MTCSCVSAAKRAVVAANLAKARTVIMVDAQRLGVDVPKKHRTNAELCLVFDQKSTVTLNDWGMTGILNFDGTNYVVSIPWSAVFASQCLGGMPEEWPLTSAPALTLRLRHLGIVAPPVEVTA